MPPCVTAARIMTQQSLPMLAKRVDVYGTHLFARLVDAPHGIGGEDVASASEQLNGIGNGGMWLNAMIAFARL